MIKLFRNIRQKLLQSGKLKSYIAYAIGEIFLVMIGILLALQINNWNENNKASLIEKTYLTNILRDLHDQMTSIDLQLEFELSCSRDASEIKSQYQKLSMFTLDSFFFNRATRLTLRKTFVITDPTYTDLISSGNIDMLKNKFLKDHIIKYYQELERLEQIIRNNNTNLIDQIYYPTFMRQGYYYSNLNESSLTSGVDDASIAFNADYNKKLENLSRKLMSTSENELQMANAINERHTVTLIHYKMMKKAKEDTQKLIDTFKNIPI